MNDPRKVKNKVKRYAPDDRRKEAENYSGGLVSVNDILLPILICDFNA